MRVFKFISGFESETPPATDQFPTEDDLIQAKYVHGYKIVDLAEVNDGVAGQLLCDRPFIIINANTGNIALKGLIWAGLSEVTVINSTNADIVVTPAPSVPGNGFNEPPLSIPKNKACKFIRDYNLNLWDAISGSGGRRRLQQHRHQNSKWSYFS
ncbi:hypothetical protein [Bdellovibrio bacteriovorus]|uniref:hypothetical protein n=1 Tax=Bdellovibrio bacteriovorus TaxID=959 RepID=UPI0035A7323C